MAAITKEDTIMADKDRTDDSKTTEVPAQKLDDGYSQPGDSRTADEPILMNAADTNFSELKGTEFEADSLPLDNTPIGQALGHSDGRDMSQQEDVDEIPLADDPSQTDKK
jgi:hypothetical protein